MPKLLQILSAYHLKDEILNWMINPIGFFYTFHKQFHYKDAFVVDWVITCHQLRCKHGNESDSRSGCSEVSIFPKLAFYKAYFPEKWDNAILMSGYIEILKAVKRYGFSLKLDVYYLYHFVHDEEQLLDLLKYMHNHGANVVHIPSRGYISLEVDSNEIASAIVRGYLKILKWYWKTFHIGNVSCNLDIFCKTYQMTAFAVKERKFKILRWLRQHGCQWDEKCLINAVNNKDFKMFKWCWDRNCPYTVKLWQLVVALDTEDYLVHMLNNPNPCINHKDFHLQYHEHHHIWFSAIRRGNLKILSLIAKQFPNISMMNRRDIKMFPFSTKPQLIDGGVWNNLMVDYCLHFGTPETLQWFIQNRYTFDKKLSLHILEHNVAVNTYGSRFPQDLTIMIDYLKTL